MNKKSIHLLVADMGYGHQRAAYPLLGLSNGDVINLNSYEGMASWERAYWTNSQKSYEKISYFKKVPILGNFIFNIMDYFQRIENFYPIRDLSKSSLQQKTFFKVVKKGVGKNLINELNKNPLPIVTSFFVAAYSAEYYGYKGNIYCIICDADIARAWAPIKPKESKIKYLCPTQRSAERLKQYGVRKENIFFTGFPLPEENMGEDNIILKSDLSKRLLRLDPKQSFRKKYFKLLESEGLLSEEANNLIPRISFAIGGAGAQREIAIEILKSLKSKIKDKKIFLNLIAGSRKDVYDYFKKEIQNLELNTEEDSLRIIYDSDKYQYFKKFNETLRETDILWTKPSELSLYAGLGLPLLMTEPVGAQEISNREWLLSINAARDSIDPKYSNQWLFDFIESGQLAQAALSAYLNAPMRGLENIKKELK